MYLGRDRHKIGRLAGLSAEMSTFPHSNHSCSTMRIRPSGPPLAFYSIQSPPPSRFALSPLEVQSRKENNVCSVLIRIEEEKPPSVSYGVVIVQKGKIANTSERKAPKIPSAQCRALHCKVQNKNRTKKRTRQMKPEKSVAKCQKTGRREVIGMGVVL